MSYAVGNVAVLTGRFTIDGVPSDPDEVTIRVRTPAGVSGAAQPTVRTEAGVYTYELELTEVGGWRWEFTGTGDAAGSQGGYLTATPSILDELGPGAVCSPGDVATAMLGKVLTDAQSARAEQLIAGLVDILEIKLNRWLYPRTVVDEFHRLTGSNTRLVLYRGPVRSITSVTADGQALADDGGFASHETATWPADADLLVTYVAGEDPGPAVTTVIADVIARTIAAGAAAGSGAIKSYSVEGTSITYGDVGDGGQGGSGRLKVGDLRALSRKRRPVLLT